MLVTMGLHPFVNSALLSELGKGKFLTHFPFVVEVLIDMATGDNPPVERHEVVRSIHGHCLCGY